jgi:outer membrane protein assembly factor BamB
MFRQGEHEIVVALDAETGRTIWEHRYHARPDPKQTAEFGQGPSATPLILGDRLVTIGSTGIMHGLSAETGSPAWSHDLVTEFHAKPPYYGYANSPVAHRGNVIALVGGEAVGAVAVDGVGGRVVWKSKPVETSYAAPILINVDGQDQVVFFSTTKVIGMNPADGSFLWDAKVVNFCRTNCTSAVWGQDNLLWAATKGVGGTRGLRLTQRDGKTAVEQVWLNRKVRVYHWNAVRVGDSIYTSSGDSRQVLSVIDVKTGKVTDQKPGFHGTNGIYADGKLILLDHRGKLCLAEPTPGAIEILSSFQLTDSVTWTVPTLIGTTLYVRDRRNIMALDLGLVTGHRVSQRGR